jgi:hypothetical protein
MLTTRDLLPASIEICRPSESRRYGFIRVKRARKDRNDAQSESAPNPATPADATKKADATMPPQQNADPADAMRQLRLKMLTTNPTDFGIQVTAEFPKVYGALAEFLIGDNTVTVVSLCDGNASLYTTSTFGVIGGQAHETVRTAATAFVNAAQPYHDAAIATTEFPYPESGRVRFYLLTFSGVRVIDTDLASIEAGSNQYGGLFEKANNVLTELRMTTQK